MQSKLFIHGRMYTHISYEYINTTLTYLGALLARHRTREYRMELIGLAEVHFHLELLAQLYDRRTLTYI